MSQIESDQEQQGTQATLQVRTGYNSTMICSKSTLACIVSLSCCSANASVTVKNTSSQTALNIQATIQGAVPGLTVSSTCPASLPSGGECAINLSTVPYPGAMPVTNLQVTVKGDNTAPSSFFVDISSPATLTTSVNDLTLSITGLTEYGVVGTPSSGVARTITIANTGTAPATNLVITQPSWPSGTFITTTCGSTLAPLSSCMITVHPGNTPTSNCWNATTPTPGLIQVSSDTTNTVSTNVLVLSYGCIYQGGYVYAFDDTTSVTSSVAGKVATTSDQSAGIIWSSNNSCTFDGGVAIYAISNISTTTSPNPSGGQEPGQIACNGAIDGTCDTNNIFINYQTISLSCYAVGLCKQTIGSFSDWYLPSICELGYDGNSSGSGCGSQATPVEQNFQSNLVEYNSLNLLSSLYWSATQSSDVTFGFFRAWIQDFSGGSSQTDTSKLNPNPVRCSRVF